MRSSVCVAFSASALESCLTRFGAYEMVISFAELQAVAAGVAEVDGANEKSARLREALLYFADRQGLRAWEL